MTTSGFWTAAPTVDPARQFRFRVVIGGEFAWWAKTCDKPKINIPVLGKDEYYLGSALPDTKPGEIIDLQPITMTFIDAEGFTDFLNSQLSQASGGECFPRISGKVLKEAFLGSSGHAVEIETIDSKGEMSERWSLVGAFPTSIDFGSLDYGSSEFVEITVTWEYSSFKYESSFEHGLAGPAPLSVPTSIEEAKKLDGGFI